MQVNHLLSAILRSPWAIQSETVLGYLPQIAAMLNGERPAATTAPAAPAELAVLIAGSAGGGRASVRTFDDAPAGSVAVHALKGVMMKQDQIGLCYDTPGTASLLRTIQAADRHANVVAHVLDIDSGGGSVDGTAEFGAGLAGLTKPVVAYSDGMIASAAYWSAVACAEIILNNETCRVGSIGVMASFQDIQPALEKMGVKFHDMVADGSEDKNSDFFAALKGDYKPYKDNVLNPLRVVFHDHVKAALGEKLTAKTAEKALKGGMFFAAEAQKMGLIDAVGSFDYAVQRALALAAGSDDAAPAEGDDSQANQLNSIPMFGKNKFSAVAALAGLSGVAMTAALVSAANDELEDKGITDASLISKADYDAFATTTAAHNATTDALAAAGVDSVVALVKQRDEAQAKADAYGDQPGEMPTTSAKEKADVSEEGAVDYNHLIAELPHNKAFENDPRFN